MIVRLPGLLRSYTGGADHVDLASVETLAAALAALDAHYPGLRFRIIDEQGGIRPHIKLFVDGELAPNVTMQIGSCRELMIVGALSGG